MGSGVEESRAWELVAAMETAGVLRRWKLCLLALSTGSDAALLVAGIRSEVLSHEFPIVLADDEAVGSSLSALVLARSASGVGVPV